MNSENLSLDSVCNSLNEILNPKKRRVPRPMIEGVTTETRRKLELYQGNVFPSQYNRVELYEYITSRKTPNKVGGVTFTLKPEFSKQGKPMPQGELNEQTALSLIRATLVQVCQEYGMDQDMATANVEIKDGAVQLKGTAETVRFILDTSESSRTIHGYIGIIPTQAT